MNTFIAQFKMIFMLPLMLTMFTKQLMMYLLMILDSFLTSQPQQQPPPVLHPHPPPPPHAGKAHAAARSPHAGKAHSHQLHPRPTTWAKVNFLLHKLSPASPSTNVQAQPVQSMMKLVLLLLRCRPCCVPELLSMGNCGSIHMGHPVQLQLTQLTLAQTNKTLTRYYF